MSAPHDEIQVCTGSDGVPTGWLAQEGDPADADEPLAHFSPEVSA